MPFNGGGAPGRIVDIWMRFQKKSTLLNVEDLQLLMIDETDTVLDLGFKLVIDKTF